MKQLIFMSACGVLVSAAIAIADQKLVDLVKKIKPSVVLIETFDKDDKPLGLGSGFFVNSKGHIVTNYHVIKGAYSATVKTISGDEYPVEGIIARDTAADIVKLAVDITGSQKKDILDETARESSTPKQVDANCPFLKLSSRIPSEGDDVIIIGSPLGLESTVSTGIVSAVRDIPAFGKILQITAPISAGSSGSPVINSKGEVIGIATFIAAEGQNLNFAIPSDKIIALKEIATTPIAAESASLPAHPNDVQMLYIKGRVELWQGNWAAALDYFQKAKEKNPQGADVWLYLGNCYGGLGRWQEAIEAYKRAIRIKPDYAEGHFCLGLVYAGLGRWEEALEAFRQAIGIKPDYPEAHYNLGVAYAKLGRLQEALEAFKQAIRIKPDDAEAHYNLGVAYAKLGRWEEAREAYKQAIRIKPDYAEAHFGLGLVYLITGDKGSAFEQYKILKPLDTELANELFNLIYK